MLSRFEAALGDRVVLTRFSCASCSYGATSRIAPERCPVCGGTVWDFDEHGASAGTGGIPLFPPPSPEPASRA